MTSSLMSLKIIRQFVMITMTAQIYIVIKGDISERMTDDDLWSDKFNRFTSSGALSAGLHRQDESNRGRICNERNSKAYRKYTPFKLMLDTNS